MDDIQLDLPRSRYLIPDVLRGMSALFWGLPIALVSSIQVTLDSYALMMRFLFPLSAFALLAYGAHQVRWIQVLGMRSWRFRVDLLRVVSLAQLLLAPFLLFYSRSPDQPLFVASLYLLGLCWCLFLLALCQVLGGMVQTIGEESMRQDFLWMKGFIGGALSLMALGWTILFVRNLFLEAERMPLILYLLHPQFLGTFLIISAIFPVTVLMNLAWKLKEHVFHEALGKDYLPPQLPDTDVSSAQAGPDEPAEQGGQSA